MAFAGRAGKAIRRIGDRPVMIVSLLTVSTGSLFYAAASPDTRFLVFGAATVWIGWVGVNLAINDTLYKMVPEESRSSYFAVYFTAVTLSFGLASMLGRHLFDRFRETVWYLPSTAPFAGRAVSYAVLAFVITAVLRVSGVLFWIRKEPDRTAS